MGTAECFNQGITPNLEAHLWKLVMQQIVQLARTYLGLAQANLLNHALYNAVARCPADFGVDTLVIRLPSDPEQLTCLTDAQAFLFLEDFDCPSEGFFTSATPCSCATTSSMVL